MSEDVKTPTLPATPSEPVIIEKISDADRSALDLAKAKKQVALAEAKAALAQNENAELAYKYVVLQIYMRYGLTEADAIHEDGTVIRGGALPPKV
jgi:hypothetical protein